MVHLVLWLCVTSFTILLISTGITYLVYSRHKFLWIRNYLAFLASLSLVMVTYTWQFFSYVYIGSNNSWIDVPVYFVNIFFWCVSIYYFPMMLGAIHHKEFSLKEKIILGAIALFPFVLIIASKFIEISSVRKMMQVVHFIISLGYLFAALWNVRQHNDLKNTITFTIAGIVAYSLLILDGLWFNFSLSSITLIPDGLITLPILGFTLGIVTLVISRKELSIQSRGNEMSSEFLEEYLITKREEEIISCLLKGYSNIQISDELYISPRTVDSHFTNIYRKCRLNSRTKLLRLISLK